MAIRRIKSRRKAKNPARARSLVANPGKRRKRAHNPRHKRKHNPKRKRHHNPGLAGKGGVFSQENLTMAMHVGIGAAAAVAVSFYANRVLFQESKDGGKTYQPTEYAQKNPTIAAAAPGALVAVAGLAVASMVQSKQVKSIAYGAAAAGVAQAVFAGVGPSIVKALSGEKSDAAAPAPEAGKSSGYLPSLNVYGMGGAFGHTERYGHSAGAYLGFDGTGNVSGYFVEGGQTMAGFSGF